jgi:hypothetical protein
MGNMHRDGEENGAADYSPFREDKAFTSGYDYLVLDRHRLGVSGLLTSNSFQRR